MSAFNKLTILTTPSLKHDIRKTHISQNYQLLTSPGDIVDSHPVQEISSGIPSKMESVLIINDIDEMNASFVFSEEAQRICEDNKFQALSISFYGNKKMKTYQDTSFINQSSSTGFTSTRNIRSNIKQSENSVKAEQNKKIPMVKPFKASCFDLNSPTIPAKKVAVPLKSGRTDSSKPQKGNIKGNHKMDLNLKGAHQRQEKSTGRSSNNGQGSLCRNITNVTSREALKSNRSILTPRSELKKSSSGLLTNVGGNLRAANSTTRSRGNTIENKDVPYKFVELKGGCFEENVEGKSRTNSTTLNTNRGGMKRDLSAELVNASKAVSLYQKILENCQLNQGKSMINLQTPAAVDNLNLAKNVASYRSQTPLQSSARRKHLLTNLLEENIKKTAKAREKSLTPHNQTQRSTKSRDNSTTTTARSMGKYYKPTTAAEVSNNNKSVSQKTLSRNIQSPSKEGRVSISSSSYVLFDTDPNLRSMRINNNDFSLMKSFRESLTSPKDTMVVAPQSSKYRGNSLNNTAKGGNNRNSMLKLKKYFDDDYSGNVTLPNQKLAN